MLYSVHKRMRSLGDALSDITKAVELNDKKTDWKLQKAKLLVNLGRCEEATAEYLQLSHNEGGKALSDKVAKQIEEGYKEASQCGMEASRAFSAYQSSDWSNAIVHFNKVLSYTSDTPDLLFMKAQCEFHTKDYYGVVSDTGKILKGYPKHIEAYQLRGEAYTWLNEMDMAVKHFREGLKMDPEHKGTFVYQTLSRSVLLLLLQVFFHHSMPLMFSFDISNYMPFLPTIQPTGCKNGHRFVKKITKKDKKADEAFEKGEYQQAIDKWWEAMNTDISLLAFVRPTLLKVVKAHIELKEYDKAVEEAKKHIDNEESIEGLFALGEAQLAGEKFNEAMQSFNRAFEIAVSIPLSSIVMPQ